MKNKIPRRMFAIVFAMGAYLVLASSTPARADDPPPPAPPSSAAPAATPAAAAPPPAEAPLWTGDYDDGDIWIVPIL